MFLMGAAMNLIQDEEAVENAVAFGYLEHTVFKLGVALLLSTIIYAIPRTVVIGALFLTAWLGGVLLLSMSYTRIRFSIPFSRPYSVY